jgi:hypothetical protein
MPRSYTRKYAERPSPPYPANDYCGQVKRGNDGAMWLSSRVGSQSACTWKPVVRSPKRRSPVRSPVRRRSFKRSPKRRSIIRKLFRSKSPVRRSHYGKKMEWSLDMRTGKLFYDLPWRRRN